MVVSPHAEVTVAASDGGVSQTDLTELITAIKGAVSGSTKGGAVGDIVIPVYVGGTMLDEIIVNAQQRANLRSGGRQNGLHAGQLKSYIQLCLALSEMAKEVRTASPKEQQKENPKFAMRTWLLRLGFIGEEYKKVCSLQGNYTANQFLKDLIMRRSNQKNVETKEYPYNIPVINLFILLDL